MTADQMLKTWCTLADALEKRPRENLQQAALRAMRRRSPNWAAARAVLRAEKLRGDEAWSELARAAELLP